MSYIIIKQTLGDKRTKLSKDEKYWFKSLPDHFVTQVEEYQDKELAEARANGRLVMTKQEWEAFKKAQDYLLQEQIDEYRLRAGLKKPKWWKRVFGNG